jgi:hypothetical protein
MTLQSRGLNPVPIFGTGLIHQLLGSSESWPTGAQLAVKPLTDWSALLRELARRHHLLDAWNPFLSSRPTLLWDELVRRRVALMGGHESPEQAGEAESVLRDGVVQILKEAVAAASDSIDPAKLNELLMATSQHMVSLNFDTFLLTNETWAVDDEVGITTRAPLSIPVHEKTIWYPHGCVAEPRSIKLGLRDYGFQPADWNALFEHFKSFESGFSPLRPARADPSSLARLCQALRSGQATKPSIFMGHLLLAPLIFFGAGLSRDEWGWWWLLNQRARNLARVPEYARPPTVIVLHQDCAEAPFWVGRPAGVTPIFVSDWDMAWQVLIEWLSLHRTEEPTRTA